MTVFPELSARERIEPTLTARIEQLAHPNNTFDARARAKELLDHLEAEARRPVEVERDALAADLDELVASKQHGAFVTCGHHVQTVTMGAFAQKIAEKRQALAERDQAVREAQQFLDRARQAEQTLWHVRSLHERYRDVEAVGDDYSCAHCNQLAGQRVPWPCPTIQALEQP